MGSNTLTVLQRFQTFAQTLTTNAESISPRNFSRHYSKFLNSMAPDEFCAESEKLASKLSESKQGGDFVGIIYSTLCKITEFIPSELEKFALKGYETAKANGDYVHMMARLNDLRKVYDGKPDKLYQYIQTLYKQEKCLKQLTRHYDESISKYHSVVRRPASREQYEEMLAYVQTEIAKLTKRKFPVECLDKLKSARQIFEKTENQRSLSYVKMLISEIEASLGINVQRRINKS